MMKIQFGATLSYVLVLSLIVACGQGNKNDKKQAASARPGQTSPQQQRTSGGGAQNIPPGGETQSQIETAANQQQVDVSKLEMTALAAQTKCDPDNALKIEQKDDELGFQKLKLDEDGAWVLSRTDIWVEKENKEKGKKMQIKAYNGSDSSALAKGVQSNGPKITCHTSKEVLDKTTFGDMSLLVDALFPQQISGKTLTGQAARRDVWKAEANKIGGAMLIIDRPYDLTKSEQNFVLRDAAPSESTGVEFAQKISIERAKKLAHIQTRFVMTVGKVKTTIIRRGLYQFKSAPSSAAIGSTTTLEVIENGREQSQPENTPNESVVVKAAE